MQTALDDDGGSHTEAGAAHVIEAAARHGAAIVLGPGLGRRQGAVAFARALAGAAQAPLLIDADGLNAHAGALATLAERTSPTVLTPHAGELARLLEVDSREVERRRLHHARAAARQSRAVVVLKGDDSIVARPDGFAAISPGATPALATAGTGDVLSGVCGALLARGTDAFTAACQAVRLHARAGALAARRVGVDGVVASDVVEEIAAARER
jgi:NAD(P)H-hydrate epimerase